ncbi:MAG: GNAT family N-acetyltransferase [Planctomycetes bacterium]|nr:GNAT family N-acetyltransferase [Planctomycetota bacterium]
MSGGGLRRESPNEEWKLREKPRESDAAAVRSIVESTGFFHPYEVDVAEELIVERLRKGPSSGYHFVFAMLDGETIGYACHGPIACTQCSHDLYWLAVASPQQGKGLGRRLLGETERRIATMGGRRVYVETSGRPQYAATRTFYERCGYRLEATLDDFYAPGDSKCVYVRVVDAGWAQAKQ